VPTDRDAANAGRRRARAVLEDRIERQATTRGSGVYCPDCGFDAEGAKFCPECGAHLERVRAKATGSGARRGRASSRATLRRPARQVKPLYLWIAVAIVPLAVVVAMVALAERGTQAESAKPVADTSGSYSQLVQRANGHFDQGAPYIDRADFASAAPYFAAAAREYDAAWAQRSTDPAVGTDYATSLFYSGDVQGAIAMVDKVLGLKPAGSVLQKALLNKGNFLSMAGRVALQGGKVARGKRLIGRARAAYQASIAVDSGSDAAAADRQGIADLQTTGTPSATP
jgi:hypothetical protein